MHSRWITGTLFIMPSWPELRFHIKFHHQIKTPASYEKNENKALTKKRKQPRLTINSLFRKALFESNKNVNRKLRWCISRKHNQKGTIPSMKREIIEENKSTVSVFKYLLTYLGSIFFILDYFNKFLTYLGFVFYNLIVVSLLV